MAGLSHAEEEVKSHRDAKVRKRTHQKFFMFNKSKIATIMLKTS